MQIPLRRAGSLFQCLATISGAVALAAPWISQWPLRAAEPAALVVTLGDSITKGVRTGVLPEETFAALLKGKLDEAGLNAEVVNVGLGGERTDQALERLERDILSLKPRFVTVMYGTNDSYVDQEKFNSRLSVDEYRQNLISLVERLERAGVRPVLMTEPRWGHAARNGLGENPNLRLEKYVIACRDVARECKLPLVDHYAYWKRAEREGTDVSTWTTDGCHPNPEGHRKMANLILPVLLEELQSK